MTRVNRWWEGLKRAARAAQALLVACSFAMATMPPALAHDCSGPDDCAVLPQNVDITTGIAAGAAGGAAGWVYLRRRRKYPEKPCADLQLMVDQGQSHIDDLESKLRQFDQDTQREIQRIKDSNGQETGAGVEAILREIQLTTSYLEQARGTQSRYVAALAECQAQNQIQPHPTSQSAADFAEQIRDAKRMFEDLQRDLQTQTNGILDRLNNFNQQYNAKFDAALHDLSDYAMTYQKIVPDIQQILDIASDHQLGKKIADWSDKALAIVGVVGGGVEGMLGRAGAENAALRAAEEAEEAMAGARELPPLPPDGPLPPKYLEPYEPPVAPLRPESPPPVRPAAPEPPAGPLPPLPPDPPPLPPVKPGPAQPPAGPLPPLPPDPPPLPPVKPGPAQPPAGPLPPLPPDPPPLPPVKPGPAQPPAGPLPPLPPDPLPLPPDPPRQPPKPFVPSGTPLEIEPGPGGSTIIGGSNDKNLITSSGLVKPIDGVYDVNIHGSPTSVSYKTGPQATDWSNMDEHQLLGRMRADGYQGGPIRLLSCSTGDPATANNFAQRLANLTGQPVAAPTDTLWIWPDGQTTIGKAAWMNDGQWKIFTPKAP